jgi:hypothetical protein
MAEFDFNQAPGKGVGGSLTRQIGMALGLRGRRGGGSEGLTARDRGLLMDKAHLQGVERDIVGGVVKENVVRTTGRETRRTESSKARSANKNAAQAHDRELADRTHSFDTLTNASTNPAFKDINLKTGSASFHPQKKGTQFGGVSEAADLTGM